MKTQFNKISEVKKECVAILDSLVDEKVVLFDFSKDDWMDYDYFELPRTIVYGKHGSYDEYYIHAAYKKKDELCIVGRDIENGHENEFTSRDLYLEDFAYLVDCVINFKKS